MREREREREREIQDLLVDLQQRQVLDSARVWNGSCTRGVTKVATRRVAGCNALFLSTRVRGVFRIRLDL